MAKSLLLLWTLPFYGPLPKSNERIQRYMIKTKECLNVCTSTDALMLILTHIQRKKDKLANPKSYQNAHRRIPSVDHSSLWLFC